jgi:hypothetical protein
MKNHLLTAILVSTTLIPLVHSAGCEVSPVLVREFLIQNHLIPAGSEFSFPEIGMVSRYELDEVKIYEGKNLIIVRNVAKISEPDGKTETSKSKEFDVIVQNPDCTFSKFEQVYKIPASLNVMIGHSDYESILPTMPSYPFYYVRLDEKSSIIDALKSIFTGIRYGGFSGFVIRSEPLSFDPTPNRKWSVIDGRFSLSRGASGEAGDIQAYHFDDDFDVYFGGAIRQTTSNGAEGAWVAPWGQSAVLEIVNN